MVGETRLLDAYICLADWVIYLGIIIQDSGNDLNVYHNETFDNCSNGLPTCNSDSAEQGRGCCTDTGCRMPESDATNIRDIDFNEWTGRLTPLISVISMN